MHTQLASNYSGMYTMLNTVPTIHHTDILSQPFSAKGSFWSSRAIICHRAASSVLAQIAPIGRVLHGLSRQKATSPSQLTFASKSSPVPRKLQHEEVPSRPSPSHPGLPPDQEGLQLRADTHWLRLCAARRQGREHEAPARIMNGHFLQQISVEFLYSI